MTTWHGDIWMYARNCSLYSIILIPSKGSEVRDGLISREKKKKFLTSNYNILATHSHLMTREGTPGRHEPPLCRIEPARFSLQTEPPLCRPSLRYAYREAVLCSKRAASQYSTAFLKSRFLCVMKNFNFFFDVVA